MKAHSAVEKWPGRAAVAIADFAPVVIRYAEDGRSLLIGMAGDCQKNKGCGDNVDFDVYFFIMWLIELKALMGKGLRYFRQVACRWPDR
ncbi:MULTISPECIES: hypothetical protein [Burkholderia]|uniref:hypothetical protein n=1 Tax=Burkholderia TaxID=32008 RepID=UPI000F5D5B6A|nr:MULTISPECIES: hypothetical protein [Burkholderia]